MEKLIYLLKDFEKISFCGYSTWKSGYKVFQIIPSVGFEWDAQCRPVAENGKVVFDGYREFTILFEWLWFLGAICFGFKWTVRNPKDFEQIPATEEELNEFNNLFEKFTSKKIEKLPQEKMQQIEESYGKIKVDELKNITFKNCDKQENVATEPPVKLNRCYIHKIDCPFKLSENSPLPCFANQEQCDQIRAKIHNDSIKQKKDEK